MVELRHSGTVNLLIFYSTTSASETVTRVNSMVELSHYYTVNLLIFHSSVITADETVVENIPC